MPIFFFVDEALPLWARAVLIAIGLLGVGACVWAILNIRREARDRLRENDMSKPSAAQHASEERG